MNYHSALFSSSYILPAPSSIMFPEPYRGWLSDCLQLGLYLLLMLCMLGRHEVLHSLPIVRRGISDHWEPLLSMVDIQVFRSCYASLVNYQKYANSWAYAYYFSRPGLLLRLTVP